MDLLALYLSDGQLCIYRLNWQRLWIITPERKVVAMCWSPDGRRLACGHADGVVSILDIEQGETCHEELYHRGAVTALTWVSEQRAQAAQGGPSNTEWQSLNSGLHLRPDQRDRTPQFFVPLPPLPEQPGPASRGLPAGAPGGGAQGKPAPVETGFNLLRHPAAGTAISSIPGHDSQSDPSLPKTKPLSFGPKSQTAWLQAAPSLSLLCSAGADGSLAVSGFGMFPLVTLDMPSLLSPAPDGATASHRTQPWGTHPASTATNPGIAHTGARHSVSPSTAPCHPPGMVHPTVLLASPGLSRLSAFLVSSAATWPACPTSTSSGAAGASTDNAPIGRATAVSLHGNAGPAPGSSYCSSLLPCRVLTLDTTPLTRQRDAVGAVSGHACHLEWLLNYLHSALAAVRAAWASAMAAVRNQLLVSLARHLAEHDPTGRGRVARRYINDDNNRSLNNNNNSNTSRSFHTNTGTNGDHSSLAGGDRLFGNSGSNRPLIFNPVGDADDVDIGDDDDDDVAASLDPIASLLGLLITGVPGPGLQAYLGSSLGEAGARRLDRSVEAAATQVGLLLARHVQPALELVVFRLGELRGYARWRRGGGSRSRAGACGGGLVRGVGSNRGVSVCGGGGGMSSWLASQPWGDVGRACSVACEGDGGNDKENRLSGGHVAGSRDGVHAHVCADADAQDRRSDAAGGDKHMRGVYAGDVARGSSGAATCALQGYPYRLRRDRDGSLTHRDGPPHVDEHRNGPRKGTLGLSPAQVDTALNHASAMVLAVERAQRVATSTRHGYQAFLSWLSGAVRIVNDTSRGGGGGAGSQGDASTLSAASTASSAGRERWPVPREVLAVFIRSELADDRLSPILASATINPPAPRAQGVSAPHPGHRSADGSRMEVDGNAQGGGGWGVSAVQGGPGGWDRVGGTRGPPYDTGESCRFISGMRGSGHAHGAPGGAFGQGRGNGGQMGDVLGGEGDVSLQEHLVRLGASCADVLSSVTRELTPVVSSGAVAPLGGLVAAQGDPGSRNNTAGGVNKDTALAPGVPSVAPASTSTLASSSSASGSATTQHLTSRLVAMDTCHRVDSGTGGGARDAPGGAEWDMLAVAVPSLVVPMRRRSSDDVGEDVGDMGTTAASPMDVSRSSEDAGDGSQPGVGEQGQGGRARQAGVSNILLVRFAPSACGRDASSVEARSGKLDSGTRESGHGAGDGRHGTGGSSGEGHVADRMWSHGAAGCGGSNGGAGEAGRDGGGSGNAGGGGVVEGVILSLPPGSLLASLQFYKGGVLAVLSLERGGGGDGPGGQDWTGGKGRGSNDTNSQDDEDDAAAVLRLVPTDALPFMRVMGTGGPGVDDGQMGLGVGKGQMGPDFRNGQVPQPWDPSDTALRCCQGGAQVSLGAVVGDTCSSSFSSSRVLMEEGLQDVRWRSWPLAPQLAAEISTVLHSQQGVSGKGIGDAVGGNGNESGNPQRWPLSFAVSKQRGVGAVVLGSKRIVLLDLEEDEDAEEEFGEEGGVGEGELREAGHGGEEDAAFDERE
eukprot:jgi/Mesvir1/5153/Mv15295-RA.1